MSLTVPTIDFGECYEKIKLTNGISDDLVIAILDKYIEKGNPITSYLLFNPKNGEKINANEICKNDTIIIKENILTIPGVDPSLVQFFADQGINVFNISDKFYTDICKDYKSPNNKDIPLKLRFQLFFPNVSLCDNGCISKGVNIKTMESICYCPFTDISQNSFISSVFEYSDTLGEMYSFISNSNIDVLFCIKDIFQFKFFKRCTGGFIIMILFLFQFLCVLVYFFKSKYKLKIYIYKLSTSYSKSLNSKINNEPPKKENKNNIYFEKHKNKKSHFNANSSSRDKSIRVINESNSKIKKNKNSYKVTYYTKYANQIIIQNIHNDNHDLDSNNIIKIKNFSKNDSLPIKYNNYFNEYLSTDPNDLDFENVIEKDKRTFFEYFCEAIKERQLIIKTFLITDNIKPKSIKIIVFLLNIIFCCLINGLIYNVEYLTVLYHINNENFYGFIPRSIPRLIYTFFIVQILK